LELNLQTLHGASDICDLTLGSLQVHSLSRDCPVECGGLMKKKNIKNIGNKCNNIGQTSLLKIYIYILAIWEGKGKIL